MNNYSLPYDYTNKKYIANINLDALNLTNKCSILDFGCGSGNFTIECIHRGYRVYAADISAGILIKIKNKIGNNLSQNLKTILLNPNQELLPFRDNQFDVIICREVLEHIPHYEMIIKEFKRILKDNGIIMISVPSSFSERLFRIFDPQWLYKSEHVNIFNKMFLMHKFNKNNLFPSRIERRSFYWSFNWFFLSLIRTEHYMGNIKNNFIAYNLLLKFWHTLEVLHLKTSFEKIGNTLFPKSYFFYLKKRT